MEDHDTALLVIDVQKKLIKPITQQEKILANIIKLIEACKILNIKKFFTEQNPDKLGETIDYLLDKDKDIRYSKLSFSCAKCEMLMRVLEGQTFANIVLCGIETHICVQQTALDLIKKGFRVYIAIDAVNSQDSIDHEVSIRRLECAGAIISTSESIIFEWCKSADRVEFKQISRLIKASKV